MGKKEKQQEPLIKMLPELPGSVTEQLDDILVGKTILPVQDAFPWQPDEPVVTMINTLNSVGEEFARSRASLVSNLCNNAPSEYSKIKHGRPVSAYFTYDPERQVIILEWGTVDAGGNAKLHTHLNRVIDFRERAMKGMTLSSGHIARTPEGIHIALIDGLSPNSFVNKSTPMGGTINTLYSHGMIPIDSGGNVQLPAF